VILDGLATGPRRHDRGRPRQRLPTLRVIASTLGFKSSLGTTTHIEGGGVVSRPESTEQGSKNRAQNAITNTNQVAEPSENDHSAVRKLKKLRILIARKYPEIEVLLHELLTFKKRGRPRSPIINRAMELVASGVPWRDVPRQVIPNYDAMDGAEKRYRRETLQRAISNRRSREKSQIAKTS
jgi:hypothetical protein